MHVYALYIHTYMYHYNYFTELGLGLTCVHASKRLICLCAYITLYCRSMDEQGQVHLDNMEAQSLTKSEKHLRCELTVCVLCIGRVFM